jgi:hypothetical protein
MGEDKMTATETTTRRAGTRSSRSEVSDTDNWEEVSAELATRISGTRSPDETLARAIAGISAASLENFTGFPNAFGGVTGSPTTESVSRAGDVAVRAFWWGFHVQISHEALESILSSGDSLNATVDAIGGSIPSPAQPWIKLLAPFVAGVHALLRSIDRGDGIYISMSWFAPGVFIPTPV